MSAFGHAGEVHTYMGTVTSVHDDGSFTMKKADGAVATVSVTANTVYRTADGSSASRADIVEGKRVVVTIGKDGRTATMIKIALSKNR